MERFLTKKARPWLPWRVLEILLMLALGFWMMGGVYVLSEEAKNGFTTITVIAWLIVFGLPLLVMVLLGRMWMNRCHAVRIARVLAWSNADELNWTQLQEMAKVRDVRTLVARLCEKRYLCGDTPDFVSVKLLRTQETTAGEFPHGGKCPMCGAQLEKRSSGSWACRYCGTAAGK
ncbi:MAG: hypothetical protein IJ343_10850 [Clostridia bacterium]|nr:hypothetical protein [Clostridia bacterium]